MNRKMALVALIAFSLLGSIFGYGILVNIKIIPTSGIIVIAPPPPPPSTLGLKIFSDAAGTIEINSIDWGNLNPGSVGVQIVYLQNIGNIAGTVTMAPGNWNPAETQTICVLSWDKEGVIISAGQIVQATLTLNVNGSVSGITNFAFDIIFTIEG